MSYKLDLSQLQRDSEQSITAQLVALVRAAIEDGTLAPGAKLPTTRALAEEAGVNHLTVVRAYKRLAGEGFVTASRGRGTFVRQAPPTAATGDGRWQHAVLPPMDRSYLTPGRLRHVAPARVSPTTSTLRSAGRRLICFR